MPCDIRGTYSVVCNDISYYLKRLHPFHQFYSFLEPKEQRHLSSYLPKKLGKAQVLGMEQAQVLGMEQAQVLGMEQAQVLGMEQAQFYSLMM